MSAYAKMVPYYNGAPIQGGTDSYYTGNWDFVIIYVNTNEISGESGSIVDFSTEEKNI